jgi:hypothetical protein
LKPRNTEVSPESATMIREETGKDFYQIVINTLELEQ